MKYENQMVSLLQISDALSDGLHKAPKFYPDGEYLFVNATNLENGRIVEKGKEKRTTYEEFRKYGVPLTKRTMALETLKNAINVRTAKFHEYTTGQLFELEKIAKVFYASKNRKQSWEDIKPSLAKQVEDIMRR